MIVSQFPVSVYGGTSPTVLLSAKALICVWKLRRREASVAGRSSLGQLRRC